MNNKPRFISIILMIIVGLLFSFTGCGDNSINEKASYNSDSSTAFDVTELATISSIVEEDISEQSTVTGIVFTDPVFYAIMKKYSIACSNLNPSGEYELTYESGNTVKYVTTFNNCEAKLSYMGVSGAPLSDDDVCMSANGKLSDLFVYSNSINTVNDFEKALTVVKDASFTDENIIPDTPSDLQGHTFCMIIAKLDMYKYKNESFLVAMDAASLDTQITGDTWAYVSHM